MQHSTKLIAADWAMAGYRIRDYCSDDASAICAIYNYYVTETTISFDIAPITCAEIAARAEKILANSPYLVAELDGEVVGYAYAKPWHSLPAYAHTFESSIYLAVNRDKQRCRGLGTALYQTLIEGLREQGQVRVLFGVPTLGNDASDGLHAKLGFNRQAVFHQVGFKHGQWLGVTYWALHL